MTEQYRHGTGKIALEFPAGIIDKGETPEQAALRELQEECGYRIDPRLREDDNGAREDDEGKAIRYLGAFPVNPDRHRGVFHVVFIDGVSKNGKTHFDSTEEIETFELSDEDLQKKIADGSLNHPLQIAGYYKFKLSQT
jgi:8-oxo-dGTP pyrophosphatase MutT (NUDIX family)